MRPRRNDTKDKRAGRKVRQAGPVPEKDAISVIYGVLPVAEALRAANRSIDRIFISAGAKENRLNDILDLCRTRSIAWSRVPSDQLERYVDAGANHQGVVAFVAAARYSEVDEILDAAKSPQLLLILDGVEDPFELRVVLLLERGELPCQLRISLEHLP